MKGSRGVGQASQGATSWPPALFQHYEAQDSRERRAKGAVQAMTRDRHPMARSLGRRGAAGTVTLSTQPLRSNS